MNKAVQKIANILGSTPVIVLFGIWVFVHAYLNPEYVTFISDTAILIGILILRDEKIQSDRFERYLKHAKSDVKKDLKKSDEVIRLLKRSR